MGRFQLEFGGQRAFARRSMDGTMNVTVRIVDGREDFVFVLLAEACHVHRYAVNVRHGEVDLAHGSHVVENVFGHGVKSVLNTGRMMFGKHVDHQRTNLLARLLEIDHGRRFVVGPLGLNSRAEQTIGIVAQCGQWITVEFHET